MTRRFRRLAILLALAIASTILLGQARDAASALRPPKGSNVALVVFEDLQCPDCARAAPLLEEAGRKYKIPVVRYNFPLPQHNWAFDAAVLAEYFESKSPELGTQFREFIFKNQPQITPGNLRSFAERFAQEHNTGLPFVLDPQGKLADSVKQDRTLGQRIPIEHTPTIYVVTNARTGQPFVEVVDRGQLFQLIEQAKAEADNVTPSTATKRKPSK